MRRSGIRLVVADPDVQITVFFVYDIGMGEHVMHGRPISNEQIQAWADEAEAGYDLQALPAARRGRPTVGDGPGTVVTARLDDATISALTQKAKAEGITTRSEAIRVAVRQWAHVT